MEIVLRAEVANAALAREAVQEFMALNGVTEDESFATLAACGEAIINVCEHAYKEAPDKGNLIVRGYINDSYLYLEIEDEGVWHKDIVVAPVDPFADRGRGIMMMNMLTDAMTFWCKINGGSVVRLVKKLHINVFDSDIEANITVIV